MRPPPPRAWLSRTRTLIHEPVTPPDRSLAGEHSSSAAADGAGGSHKRDLVSERGDMLTPEQEARYGRDEDSIYLQAPAGDAILMHNWLLHRSGVNPTGRPRRAASACYLDGATRHVRDPEYRFPLVFGEGALRPAAAAGVRGWGGRRCFTLEVGCRGCPPRRVSRRSRRGGSTR
jgi:phytanoyl-CoA dioxygenase PhyH